MPGGVSSTGVPNKSTHVALRMRVPPPHILLHSSHGSGTQATGSKSSDLSRRDVLDAKTTMSLVTPRLASFDFDLTWNSSLHVAGIFRGNFSSAIPVFGSGLLALFASMIPPSIQSPPSMRNSTTTSPPSTPPSHKSRCAVSAVHAALLASVSETSPTIEISCSIGIIMHPDTINDTAHVSTCTSSELSWV